MLLANSLIAVMHQHTKLFFLQDQDNNDQRKLHREVCRERRRYLPVLATVGIQACADSWQFVRRQSIRQGCSNSHAHHLYWGIIRSRGNLLAKNTCRKLEKIIRLDWHRCLKGRQRGPIDTSKYKYKYNAGVSFWAVQWSLNPHITILKMVSQHNTTRPTMVETIPTKTNFGLFSGSATANDPISPRCEHSLLISKEVKSDL